jgi:TonB family protein
MRETRRRLALFATSIATSLVFAAPRPAAGQGAHGVVPPVVVHHVDAVYPPSALVAREHADVVLAVTVDADGHVSKAEVLESGGADLDEAATVAAREWTFVPAMRDGKPVASRIKMPFHFAPPAPPPEIVETPPPGDVPVHDAVPSTPPAPAPPASPPQAVEEVSVTGRARSPSRGGADFELPLGQLAVVPRGNAADFLKLAPGVLVTNEGGEGHADSITLRGFDAGEGESMEITVGGVPVNDPGNFHGNGYADSHFILPEVVESVRVLEGPFDPHQGNFAVAGSSNYELGLAQRGLTTKWTTGSYDTQKLLLAWGPEGESAHTFAAAQYASTDGYGQNRGYKSGSAIAQYEGKLGDHGSWRVTGQAYSVVAGAAGVVREDDYDAGRIGFYGTYDPNQGQDTSRFSIAADLETRSGDTTLTQQLYAIDRSLRIREDFTGYVSQCTVVAGTPSEASCPATSADAPGSTLTFEDPRGTMLDLAMSEQSIGARGSARTHGEALGQTQEFEIGYFARGDNVSNVQHLVDRATQAVYATNADLSGFLGDIALYADASLKPLSWITLRGGAREELFTYTVDNGCTDPTICAGTPATPASPRTNAADSKLLPRGTVLFGPFEGVTLHGGYGRGVRSLAIDDVASDPNTPLATIDSYEGGVEYAHGLGSAGQLTLRSSFYDTEIDRDEVLDPALGRNVETGATERTGWVGAGRFTGRFLDEAANVAVVRAVFKQPLDGSPFNGVPYVPSVLARSDTAVFGDLPWALGGHPIRASFGPSVTYVGKEALQNGESTAPYVLVDAALKLSWRAFELGLTGTNLFDLKYRLSEFVFVSDFHTTSAQTLAPERSFTAGAPRMLFLSLSATVGG